MDVISEVLSGASLVAVVIIGWRSIRLGERSTKASEESAKASVESAHATERSVNASERAAALAEQDAKLRRIEAVLDVVLEMRELFNRQKTAQSGAWVPPSASAEALERTALCRKLEGRLLPFERELDQRSIVRSLAATYNWRGSLLDDAIEEIKVLLRLLIEPPQKPETI